MDFNENLTNMVDFDETFDITEYNRIIQRINVLYTGYYASNNILPNTIFMMEYHFQFLLKGTEMIVGSLTPQGPVYRIFNMEIQLLSPPGDKMFVGYVDQG